MAVTVRKVRLGAKARVVIPKEACDALGFEPGGLVAFVIDGDDIRLTRASAGRDDPFACFSERASAADRKGYGDL